MPNKKWENGATGKIPDPARDTYTTNSGWKHTWGQSYVCPVYKEQGHKHTTWNSRRMCWECACGAHS